MKLISIKDVLLSPNKNQNWFCLPPNVDEWTLETQGVFTLNSIDFPPDSEDYLPKQVKEDGWVEVLDGASIEEIVANASLQLVKPTIDDLFNAFVFYFKNDAFIIF
ncbi:conserved hypothetical protein [Enterobacterales bacterium 8AC]|nr:conserved hypothetical protein [Enterobacterales bacterium 8AC]